MPIIFETPMSNYSWYPGAMPFPADYVTSAYYPYHPHYRNRASSAGKSCGVGLARVYPQYANRCQQCKPFTRNSCAGTYPPFWHGKGYYNPSGVPYGETEFGTSEGTCDPRRGCLDPKAANYDKLALTHCQGACIYRRPRVCIPAPVASAQPACDEPCVVNEAGRTPEQAIYDAPRGTRAGPAQAKHRHMQALAECN